MSATYEPPRRVVLGTDAWQLLVRELGGLTLPQPLREQDGPVLDAAQEAAALGALRAAGLVTGDRPLADLHPSLRASLLVQLRPELVVDTVVQRGPERTTARHAAAGPLAAGLQRSTTEVEAGRETGPVELSTLLLDDLAAEVVAVLGPLPAVGDREPAELDSAASLAVVTSVQQGRREVAASLTGGAVPPVLEAIAAGLQAVAEIVVTASGQRHVIVLLGTAEGWWSVHTPGEDVVLRPVDTGVLVTQVATALTAGLARGMA